MAGLSGREISMSQELLRVVSSPEWRQWEAGMFSRLAGLRRYRGSDRRRATRWLLPAVAVSLALTTALAAPKAQAVTAPQAGTVSHAVMAPQAGTVAQARTVS